MKAFFSQKKKAILARTIVLGLCLVTPWNRAEAMSVYETQNGLIQMYYLDACEGFIANGNFIESQSTLPDWQKERINFAADYWDGLLKHTKTAGQPVALAVVTDDTDSGANTVSYLCGIMEDGKPVFATRPNAVLNHGITLTEEEEPAGTIIIGTATYPADGEKIRYDTPLPQNSAASLAPTIIHEIGHAMGLVCAKDSSVPAFYEYPFLYESHLYDWRGVQARPGMEIQTVNHRAASAEYFDLPAWLPCCFPYSPTTQPA